MSLRGVRRFAIGFFVVYAITMIYPGVVPFRGPRPFILGMPFAMAWAAAWVVAAFFVLLLLDRAYRAAERRHDDDSVRDADGAARSRDMDTPATER